ncbi:MAG: thiamine-phosphate kinase [Solirubrobacterales bacterium]
MAASESDRIAQLSEIFGVQRRTTPLAIGDDAAVVRNRGDYSVTSVDAVVDGVHFLRKTYPARAIGRKATAAALSDLAAMGTLASEVYVAAGIPADVDDAEFTELAAGIAETAERANAVVVGGDLTDSPVLWLSVTVVGYADRFDDVVTRAGATEADVVAVTGTLGASAAAIELLAADAPPAVPEKLRERLTARQLAPTPLIEVGRALAAIDISAMLDVSDGVARDSDNLARASGHDVLIELARLPIDPAAADFADRLGREPTTFAAASGEEYELLVALHSELLTEARRICDQHETNLTVIGRVGSPAGDQATTQLLDSDGRVVVVRGFEHF